MNPKGGLGGHCIPIDPFYLTWKAREYGVHTRFIELAGQINRRMPEYVVQRTMVALNDQGKAVKGSRILLLRLAYKADVDDMRESPTFELLDRFQALGAEVSYHDPYVPEIGPTREPDRLFFLFKSKILNHQSVISPSSAEAILLRFHSQLAPLGKRARRGRHALPATNGRDAEVIHAVTCHSPSPPVEFPP